VNLLTFLKKLLFPTFCIGCFRPGTTVCLNCYAKLNPYNNLPSEQFSLFYYDSFASRILKKAKYRGYQTVFTALIENMSLIKQLEIREIVQKNSCTEVCYIPITEFDYRIRGYNQAEFLAKFLAKSYHLALNHSLIKIRQNQKQSMLRDTKERYNNIQGAYQVNDLKLIRDKNILLVDDVITTGSTINEAARVLLRAGARRVIRFSIFCTRRLKG